MSTMLDTALQYAARGWRVMPLYPPADGRCSCRSKKCDKEKMAGKHPRILDWSNKATADETAVRKWWRTWPDSGIGILTGDGLVILDSDPRNGGDKSLEAIEANHGPLDTLTASTGRGDGGKHFYLAGSGIRTKPSLAPGIDVKGVGGMVVAPPSLHASGKPYRWLNQADPQPVPPWLPQLMNGAGSSAKAAAVEGDILAGSRNTTLTSLAGTMNRRGMSERAILAALAEENKARCRPPLELPELQKIARSVARYPPADEPNDMGDPRTERLAALEKVLGLAAVKLSIARIVKRGRRGGTFVLELSDERSIVLGTASDILMPWRVQAAVLDQVAIAPAPMKRGDWTAYAQAVAEFAEVVETVTQEEEAQTWIAAFARAKARISFTNDDDLRSKVIADIDGWTEGGSDPGQPPKAFTVGSDLVIHMPSFTQHLATCGTRLTQQQLGERISAVGFRKDDIQVRSGERRIRWRIWRGSDPRRDVDDVDKAD